MEIETTYFGYFISTIAENMQLVLVKITLIFVQTPIFSVYRINWYQSRVLCLAMHFKPVVLALNVGIIFELYIRVHAK